MTKRDSKRDDRGSNRTDEGCLIAAVFMIFVAVYSVVEIIWL